MARNRIGVDVGSTAVRAAELSVASDPPVLTRAAQIRLRPGIVENGEVRNPDALAEALRELWNRGGFRGKQVALGVGNQRVVVREISLPYLPEKELREALPFQVQEFIPLPVEDAILDFEVLEEFEEDARRMARILLVAAQRDMVGALVDAAMAARLEPALVDLAPFALIRAVGATDGLGLDGGGEAVVDIGADVTNICVHELGTPRFVRILPSAGHDITVAVGRALGLDDEVAERAKRGGGVEGGPSEGEVERIAMGRAATFVDEVRSSLDFYMTQAPGTRIHRLVVTGGGSKLPGLIDQLGERTGIEAVQGRPFERVEPRLSMPEEELREAEPVLAVAVGLALPGE